MTIKQRLAELFEANPEISKKDLSLYQSYYKVASYDYDLSQNKHDLTITSSFKNNLKDYKLEKIGELNPDLLKCLKEKEEIVYFWKGYELKLGGQFTFLGKDNYYWTIFPKKDFIEKHDAQKWLDKNYSKKARGEVTELGVVGWQLLEGDLDLSEFTNLKELNCSDNQLTNLTISDKSRIEKLNCSNNSLTDINSILSSLDSEKLKELDLSNNNDFPESDLIPFSRFINLESLSISNNNFFGSLEPLKDLTKLKKLDVSNTDIDSGLEFLPFGLEKFLCYDPDKKNQEAKATELYEKEFQSIGSDISVWREFYNSPAQNWLDKKYPKNKRKNAAYLNISKKGLKGGLKLAGFTGLKELNCSNNHLTNLDLSGCLNLQEIDCFNNEFNNSKFLKSVANLERLSMQNNQKLFPQNLKHLTHLKNLKKLDISNCPFEGSLKPLENLNKLEELYITNTNISEGLEDLPASCQKLYCELDYGYKTMEIIKELNKSNCSEKEKKQLENTTKYYNLTKWREDKQDSIALVIPLERLFVIKINIRKFLEKWGGKDKENYGYLKSFLIKFGLAKDKSDLTKLGKLKSPQEIEDYRNIISSIQWTNRVASVVGGSLLLVGTGDANVLYTQTGGIIAIVSPFVEVVTSQMEGNFYEENKRELDEFNKDAEYFLDNYHELLGIIESIKIGELGRVNDALKDLKEKFKEFSEKYDGDKNGIIDIDELMAKRNEFEQELNNSKLDEIVYAIKQLEKEIIDYRQGSSKKERDEEIEKQQEEIEADIFRIDIIEDEESLSQVEISTDNNSSSHILNKQGVSKNKKTLFTGNNPWFTNLTKRRKSLTHSKINESYELQSQEQVAQTLHVPLHGSSSSK